MAIVIEHFVTTVYDPKNIRCIILWLQVIVTNEWHALKLLFC